MVHQIDWDKIISESMYSDIDKLAASLPSRLPTMFSPCKKFIYISSLDINIEVKNTENLMYFLKLLKKEFTNRYCDNSMRFDYSNPSFLKKLTDYYEDYIFVFDIASQYNEDLVSTDPNEFLFDKKKFTFVLQKL